MFDPGYPAIPSTATDLRLAKTAGYGKHLRPSKNQPMKANLFLALAVFAFCGPGLCFAQTWTQTSAPSASWSCIASSADGSRLAAIATGGNGGVWTSADSGNTWTSNSIPSANWVSIASSADGSRLAAAMGYPSTGPIYISTNSGATWTSNNFISDWSAVACSADGNKLLAVTFNDGNGGNGAVWISTNSGHSWISNDIPYLPPGNFRTFLSAASSAEDR